MDLQRLVRHVAAAMGADATADRVESVARAILDSEDVVQQDRVIITAFGLDQPGILAGVTGIVAEAGCNILDVSQKILQGYFTMIMIADIAAMKISLTELQGQLRIAGPSLGVRVGAQHEELFARMHRP